MANPIHFSWRGTDNPNDPSGVATFKCNMLSVTVAMDDFATASKLSSMMHSSYQTGRNDAIDRVDLSGDIHCIRSVLQNYERLIRASGLKGDGIKWRV